MTELAHLGVCEAATLLRARTVSASELTAACLARIRERDGVHSRRGSGIDQRLGAGLRGRRRRGARAADSG